MMHGMERTSDGDHTATPGGQHTSSPFRLTPEELAVGGIRATGERLVFRPTGYFAFVLAWFVLISGLLWMAWLSWSLLQGAGDAGTVPAVGAALALVITTGRALTARVCCTADMLIVSNVWWTYRLKWNEVAAISVGSARAPLWIYEKTPPRWILGASIATTDGRRISPAGFLSRNPPKKAKLRSPATVVKVAALQRWIDLQRP